MRITTHAHALAIALLLSATAPAHANIRAPVMRDGTFTEHIRGAHPSAVLLRERFVARLPSLVTGDGDDHDQLRLMHARVEVEYDIENTSSLVVTIPVRFLAVGATNAAIRVNDVAAPHQPIADADERRAARKHIAHHRCAWAALDAGGGGQMSPGDCRVGDDENANRVEDWYTRSTRDRRLEDVAIDSLAFDVVLRPGVNTVRVVYDQPLRFREGSYGYFSGLGLHGARYGFEYLLYPAETWQRSDGFTFDVFVDVPDVRERGLFGDTFLASQVFTNLPLEPVRQPHPGTTVSGRLTEFPSEVMAIVVVAGDGGLRLF